MAKRVQMKVAQRVGLGGSASKKSRRAGNVPAVLYGIGEPMGLEVNAREMATILNTTHAEHMLVDLEVATQDGGSQKRMAIVQDIQIHPLKDKLIHIDFHEISESSKLHVEIPIHAVGEPVGVRSQGGVLDHLIHKLRVECLPKDLPDSIEVNVEALELDQAVHVGDLKLPDGVTSPVAKDLAVFMVHAPRVVEETTAAATETKEPEVLKEKKVEGDEKAEAKPEAKKSDAKK